MSKACGIACAASSVAVVAAFFGWLLYPINKPLKITSMDWESYIEVEQLYTVREHGTYIPKGGRLIRHWTELEFSTQIDSDGNMYLTPEIETHYEYDIERWQHYVTVSDSSDTKTTPRWPEITLDKGNLPNGAGDQRESRRVQILNVGFEDGYSTAVTREQWDELEVGQLVYIKMFRFGYVIGIQSAEQ